ncbi:GNAT family N-acetyltransferase [Anaerobacillus isosaccharinicus]|uniref:GNAT family N-acetyltransferase n=1 Tax=Anaerobacillus isosaccharinicus TaxID=1532552 RepID=A0A1S2LIY2_9BACI|nr:GNAT family protein [Anaerobacillus isosaccharinicus]MBA5586165.1 GNAT family N-acetyltransferase [Anaerobacillus isosaccharinicus]QOY35570.1 GNAT family N-acetyltransferase [Anaerobacillus isosaccharinicus]
MLAFVEVREGMVEGIVKFLISDTWPFHGEENPTEELIRMKFQKGVYTADGNKSFWIIKNNENIGLIRLFDLPDPTCLFDIRLSKKQRGQGFGVEAVNWLTDYVFTNCSHINRIEGHTRNDNFAMRKTFFKCGYVKEAYHRKAWPQKGFLYDSIGYAMIREDWANKTKTLIDDKFEY